MDPIFVVSKTHGRMIGEHDDKYMSRGKLTNMWEDSK
jgi:hypothetical protein